MKKYFLMALVVLLLSVFACSGGDDDDADTPSGDDDDGDDCPISNANLAEVNGQIVENSCGNIGLTLVLDHVRVNPSFTIFEIRGQHSIDNDNEYYLRGAGLGDVNCFAHLENAGTYVVRTELLACAEYISFDVVTAKSGEANSFCDVTIQVDIECGDDDDDTTDDDTAADDDDDDDDDDTPDEECAANYTWFYDVCEIVFLDGDGYEIYLDDIIWACDAGDVDYGKDSDIYECIDLAADCDEANTCLGALFP